MSPKEKNSPSLLSKTLQQKQFATVYLFFGEEDYLVEQYAEDVLAAALQTADRDFNLDIFYANEIDGAAVVNAAAAFPMMAERRVVIVKEFHHLNEGDQELLLKYMKKASPTTCLVLTSSKFTSTSALVKKILPFSFALEAKPLYENQVPQWIDSHLKKRGLTISADAAGLLQANIGVSLRRLASEIDKIELLLSGRAAVTVADVEAVVGSSKEFSVYEFGDAVVEKKLEKSLRVLNRLLELGESPVYVLAMLTRHFIALAKAKSLSAERTSREESAKILKTNPFFVEKYMRQAVKYQRQHLEDIFALLLKADQHLKTSYQKPRLVLELLIFEIYSIS